LGPGETARGVISLVLCLHFVLLATALWANYSGSPLQNRLLELTAPYGVTLNLVPESLKLHWTEGSPLDDDHRLEVSVEEAAGRAAAGGEPRADEADDSPERGLAPGRTPLERVYLRRLASRLAEYQVAEDSEQAAVLAGSLGTRAIRQTGVPHAQVRAERLEPALRDERGLGRGAVGETAYSADVFLDRNGRVMVLTDTPAAQAAQPAERP
jgi:hypothetical protein